MSEVWIIEIYTLDRNGEVQVTKFEDPSLVGATRYVYTFKPKRGHEVLEYRLLKERRLF